MVDRHTAISGHAIVQSECGALIHKSRGGAQAPPWKFVVNLLTLESAFGSRRANGTRDGNDKRPRFVASPPIAYPDGGAVIDTRTKRVAARIPTSEKLAMRSA